MVEIETANAQNMANAAVILQHRDPRNHAIVKTYEIWSDGA
jgi:hypothetical protein